MTGIGFRVIAVVLSGRASDPSPVARRIVELSDPNVHETKQPYHAGTGEAEEDAREIARRTKIIERCATASVDALVEWSRTLHSQDRGRGDRLRAGLVVGSVIDPADVANPHIRAHANEGRLFRTVLEDALRTHGIASDVLVEKQLAATARQRLSAVAPSFKRTIETFGKTLGGPWRAEEKAAAVAAWLALR